jgi:hypothetical protein
MMSTEFISNDFWRIRESNGRETITIDKSQYFKFLESNGFGKIYLDGEKLKPTFIIVRDNVVRIVSRDYIITFSRLYIMKMIQDEQLYNLVYEAYIDKIVSKPESVYSMLKVSRLEFIADLNNIIYFCFRNKIIAVSSEGLQEIDYKDSSGAVWEDLIIPFDINVNNVEEYFTSAEFNQFLVNISTANEKLIAQKRYDSLLTMTGYLIHEYRDLSKMKAIILMDSNLSSEPEGGAGKGLYMQGIKQVRQTVTEDGKNFTFKSQFAFQQVKPSTRVLFFDDVNKAFDFEKLFSSITEGITTEKKYKDRFFIPAEKSPRIVISTNYALLGVGGSFERRKYEFEFSNHYNRNHSPADEFKHIFFNEWTTEEWNKFYNLMFFACQKYLNSGLVEASSINGGLKRLIHSTSPEFYEFAQGGITVNTEYDKKELYQKFQGQYPDYSLLKQRTFTNWLKSFSEVKNLRQIERKSGDNYFITFIESSIP